MSHDQAATALWCDRLRNAPSDLARVRVLAEALAAERAAGAREMRDRAVVAIDAARERECAEYGGYDGDRVDDGMSAARCIVEALPLDEATS